MSGSEFDYLNRSELHAKAGQRFTVKGVDYQLQGVIGDGAVGVVRKAINLDNGEQVVIKFLAPDSNYISENSFEDVNKRFRREGIRGSKLNHDNLIKIIGYENNFNGDCFNAGNPKNPFIIMEYISGCTLESRIKALATNYHSIVRIDENSLKIAHEIVLALRHLHSRQIVHRDVKPSNIFISTKNTQQMPTKVKLGDFGVVKWGDYHASVATGTLTLTKQKEGLGTFKYMSPEQAIEPKTVTARSDMYSLGITLFELFTNHILQSHQHVFQIMSARLQRGTVLGKLRNIGITCDMDSAGEDIMEDVLDMFLTSPAGRPSSKKMAGRLEWEIERLNPDY